MSSDIDVTEYKTYLYKIPEAMTLLAMSRSVIYEPIPEDGS